MAVAAKPPGINRGGIPFAKKDQSVTFICSITGCGKVFNSRAGLIAHEGWHANKGTYECPECKAKGVKNTFSMPQALGAHRSIQHGVTGTSRTAEGKRVKGKVTPEPAPPAVVPPPVKEPEPFMAQPPMGYALSEKMWKRVEVTPADAPLSETIEQATKPLFDRYEELLHRHEAIKVNLAAVEADLDELFKVIAPLADSMGREITPLPTRAATEESGVSIKFGAEYSQQAYERAEAWVAARSNRFTIKDLERAIGLSNSTCNKLVQVLRDEGKVRLVGKRGPARVYQKTQV